MKNIYIISLLALTALLIGSGCTPSVRYTRDQPAEGRSMVDDIKRLRKKDKPDSADTTSTSTSTSTPTPPPKGSLEKTANSYLGVPYKYGGSTRAGLDCSGFVTLVFREVYNRQLPRSSSKMWKEGIKVPLSAARPGDLVFFRGGSFGAIDHVGIYMGKNRFIHASTSSGVTYNSISETYFSKRFAGVRRVI